jgi:hypothetical protein
MGDCLAAVPVRAKKSWRREGSSRRQARRVPIVANWLPPARDIDSYRKSAARISGGFREIPQAAGREVTELRVFCPSPAAVPDLVRAERTGAPRRSKRAHT